MTTPRIIIDPGLLPAELIHIARITQKAIENRQPRGSGYIVYENGCEFAWFWNPKATTLRIKQYAR